MSIFALTKDEIVLWRQMARLLTVSIAALSKIGPFQLSVFKLYVNFRHVYVIVSCQLSALLALTMHTGGQTTPQ